MTLDYVLLGLCIVVEMLQNCFQTIQVIRRMLRITVFTLNICSSSRDRYIHYSKVPTMHYQASLPRLPVPKLADSCSRYLKAVRPLVDDLQFQKTEKNVAEFQQQGGNGESRLR